MCLFTKYIFYGIITHNKEFEIFSVIGFDIGETKCAVTCGEISNGELVVKDKRFLTTDKNVSPYDKSLSFHVNTQFDKLK